MTPLLLASFPETPKTCSPLVHKAARAGVVRRAGIRLLGLGLSGDAGAGSRIKKALRSERSLGSKDRRLVSETAWQTIKCQRRLVLLLERDGWRGENREKALWLAALVRWAGLPPEEAELQLGEHCFQACAHPLPTVEKWLSEASPTDEEVLARLGSLPDWFARTLLAEHTPKEAAAIAISLQEKAPTTLRANTRHITREALVAALIQEGIQVHAGTLSPQAIHVDMRANLVGLAPWRKGLFEIQDEGSQLVAQLVQPARGNHVVDFCAGAGGKTLALAATLPRGARLWAFETRPAALDECRHRLKRARVRGVESHRIAGEGDLPIPPQSAQRVLVDAPCSGSGTWRRHGTARWNSQAEDIDAFRELQGRILKRASSLVAPEGRLIYATCSLLKAENEEVVDRFLQDNPSWAIMEIREVSGGLGALTTEGPFLKTLPHRHGCDAFFAAVLVPDK